MKNLKFVLVAIICLGVSSAHAVTLRQIDFTISNFSVGLGDPFGALGIAPVTEITGSVVIDTDLAPLSGPATIGGGTSFEQNFAYYGYQSYTVNIGSVVLNGLPAAFPNVVVVVSDAVGASVQDVFGIQSQGAQLIGPDLSLNSMSISALSAFGPNVGFTGTDIPSVSDLNALDQYFVNIAFTTTSPTFQIHEIFGDADIVFSSPSLAVPEPSSVALFCIGLVGLNFARGRRQRARHG